MSTMKSKGRREVGVEYEPQEVEAAASRLAGLLPEEALQDAVRGLGPEDVSGRGGLLSQLAGRVIEAALQAEMTVHVGHPPGGVPASGNRRNGHTPKTVSTDLGPVDIRTPRDRDGSFEPRMVAKRQTRLAGLDEKIIALYSGGMSVRDISAHLSEIYGTDIGRDTVSRITDAVLEDVAAWRSRPRCRRWSGPRSSSSRSRCPWCSCSCSGWCRWPWWCATSCSCSTPRARKISVIVSAACVNSGERRASRPRGRRAPP